ncbi:DNase I-like protein [Trametes sanguinea]|nr:DNase I-like protein [Trametes sanguinea]
MNGFGVLTKDHPDNKWGLLYRMMNEEGIGVLMLQETHLTEERRLEVQRMFGGRIRIYHSEHPTSPRTKEGVAVVINKRLVSTEGIEARTVVQGRAIQVQIKWCGGEERRVLCVYAPTSDGPTTRCDFFKALIEQYEGELKECKPNVLAGDFNNVESQLDSFPSGRAADPSVECLSRLKAVLQMQMVDGWRRVNPSKRDYTFVRGSGESLTMSRLDRIYVKKCEEKWAWNWRIIHPSVRTDHTMPVVDVSVRKAPQKGRGRPIFPLHLLKDKKLTQQMRERCRAAAAEIDEIKRAGRTQESNPQWVLQRMKGDWLAMARQREKETVPKADKEIREHEKELERAKAENKGGEREAQEVATMSKQLADLKNRRLKQQQAKSRAKHRALGETASKYWTAVNKEKEPRNLIPAFRIGGEGQGGAPEYERDSGRMAEMAKRHYDSIQLDGPEVGSGPEREEAIQEALNSLKTTVPEDQRAEMEKEPEYDECEFALRHTKAGTAPGLDGIQYEVWRAMHARFEEDTRHEGRKAADAVMILLEAFKDISRHGVCPGTGFAEGWIVPIYKEKGDVTEVVNYRPITLLNADYKLLTKMMAMKLATQRRRAS